MKVNQKKSTEGSKGNKINMEDSKNTKTKYTRKVIQTKTQCSQKIQSSIVKKKKLT